MRSIAVAWLRVPHVFGPIADPTYPPASAHADLALVKCFASITATPLLCACTWGASPGALGQHGLPTSRLSPLWAK
jgi:hypothetical protein